MTPLSSLDGVTESEAETDYVILTVRKYGTIVIRLYPDVAPETVANFKSLVSQKFYDGLIFHRVIKGFMIQGGDPLGTGRGGSGTNIKGEFALNGFENNLSHVRGVISMARSDDQNPNTTADLNSASSQFFICQQDYAYGDGSYAAFGYVVYGMDAVDSIASVRTNSSDKPATDVVIESIRFATVAG
ncbi:MAG: peptidylprolyl isomerase [Ruminococcaceae bacterium]|nr:peptidylprolyl isomerase [Oscillospiraceae bacterium]